MIEYNKEYMMQAIEQANENARENFKNGGPFGAVIVKNGKVIATAHNTVIQTKDATAHAEINAIRMASKILNTHDLNGCILYTSAEPCPMCLSAIIWANIKEVFYANTKEDADKIGFRDDIIYEFIKGKNKETLNLKHINIEEAKDAFEKFKSKNGENLY